MTLCSCNMCSPESRLQAKPERLVFDFAVTAAVAMPLLNFSARNLVFEYFHNPAKEQQAQQQRLTIANVSKLPLAASLRAPPPFALSQPTVSLEPGASDEIVVSMDHDFRKDSVSLQLKCVSSQRMPIVPFVACRSSHTAAQEVCRMC
jgi:hypothetical protein